MNSKIKLYEEIDTAFTEYIRECGMWDFSDLSSPFETTEYPYLHEHVRRNEEMCNLLLETEAVAMDKYKESVAALTDDIVRRIKNNTDGSTGVMKWNKKWLPLSGELKLVRVATDNGGFVLTDNDFPFVVDCDLLIVLQYINGDLTEQDMNELCLVVAENAVDDKQKVLPQKKYILNQALIRLMIPIINGKVYRNVIYMTLFHELSHTFQTYSILKNTENDFDKLAKPTEQTDDFNKTPLRNTPDGIKTLHILYVLWNMKELSAWASMIYAELETLNSNNRKDINNTRSYKCYTQLRDEIFYIEKHVLPDNEIWNVVKTAYKTKSKPNGYVNTSNALFRELFIRHSVERLKKYYEKMLKAASLYYKQNGITPK